MRISSKRPPLPAPTESSVSGNNIEQYNTSDVGTDLSHLTDRTHYSVPDDGREIKVPTKKIVGARPLKNNNESQASFLIEYYDAGKHHDSASGRPSVRVKVTPHARRVKAGEVKVTEVGNARKPSYTRRISLGNKNESKGPPVSYNHSLVDNSNVSSDRSDIEVEVMGHQSELSELPAESNVSSMPGDSVLDAPVKIEEPRRRRSRSLERTEEAATAKEDAESDKLRAPDVGRSRSLSKERITRKALEMIAREQSPEPVKPRRLHKSRPQSSGSDRVAEEQKGRSRRSSNSHRESSDLRSYTESSLLPPRDNESNLSGGSKVSLNNPKLLATVEDAIRRLILPEIETLKRNQSTRSTRTRDSFVTDESVSRSGTGRRLSKATSEPYVKGRHSDETSSRDAERRRRKHKKSSRDVESDATSSRRDSLDSIAAEKERIRKSKAISKTRDHKDSNTLTRANLKSHTSRSDVDKEERRHKHKHRSKSKGRSESIAETEEEYYRKNEIPPMPLNSEIQDSELTRTSLLSAETAESEDLHSRSDRTAEEPRKTHVGRDGASSSTTKSAREVRSKDSRDLKSTRSDRSISTKHKGAALSAAGLGGAAGGLYGYKAREHSRPTSRSSRGEKRVSSREEHSPARSTPKASREGKSKDVAETETTTKTSERPAAVREMSKDSVNTTSSTEYPVTHKRATLDRRHETLNYSEPDLLTREAEGATRDTARDDDAEEDAEDFYEHQHELNNQYRNSLDEEELQQMQRESGNWSQSVDETPQHSTRDSVGGASLGRVADGQQLKNAGANPKVIDQPHGAESAVASLINQSMLSEQSGPLEPSEAPDLHHKGSTDRLHETRDVQAREEEEQHAQLDQHEQLRSKNPQLYEQANPSAERWGALRDRAMQLSSGTNSLSSQGGNNSPAKQDLRESYSMERPRMGSNAIPGQDDDMPEVGYGHDAASELTDHDALKPRPDSIVEGPLGDEYENRGLWPYEPTPDLERRGGFIHPHDRDSRSIDSGVAAAVGAGAAAGTGLGIGAAGTPRSAKSSQPSLRQQRSESAPSEDGRYVRPQGPRQPHPSDRQYVGPSPNNQKDEGYISAAHPRSPSVGSPLSFSKPPPQLFDDRDTKNFDPSRYAAPPTAATPEDPFVMSNRNAKHNRHMSANSHGIPAESYDAATGAGMNHIMSKDVVALMDHLTVRDGHRNARDTEILVTLVRSAAEMRNQFDDLKNQVDMQGQLGRRHDTKEAQDVVSKIMTGTRAAALAQNNNNNNNNSGPLRSSRFASPASERDEPPAKKKNIFKRALSGLNSKPEKDISKLEDMLMQLLEDVEALRDAQASSFAGGSQNPILPAKASLDSYERLRAAPESGYEPDGQAGTSSTPNVSGTFSPANSRQSAHRMHSGYNVNRDSVNRISTVHEHPDEHISPNDPRYENDDGMLTPTQEAQNQRSAAAAGVQPPASASDYHTPPSGNHNRGYSTGKAQLTPRSVEPQGRQKSTSSSMFGGVPRISRWSKTTTSSGPRDSFQHDTPYSEHSQSGSDVNVLPGAEGAAYAPHEDDRLRSANSLARDGRSPSPLLPQDELPMDDPKYHANRHSLTLQHPQPRQGSTHRHQSHLESQAYGYDGRAPSERSVERPGDGSPGSPPADLLGSTPGLPKNRMSVRRTSRGTSGEYGTPQSTGSGGYRAPEKRDEGPLVPAQQPTKETRGAPGNGRRDSLDSLDDDRDDYEASEGSYRRAPDSLSTTPDERPDTDAESVPDNVREDWSEHTSDTGDEEEAVWPRHSVGVPIDRPRSPYYPGAQLTTIEERYSLEQSRISSPLSRHQSVRSRDPGAGSESIAEEDEGDVDTLGDDSTPTQGSPTKAGSSERKVTPLGPRAMPGQRVSSGGRKPVGGHV